MNGIEDIYNDERLKASLWGPVCIATWFDAPQVAQVEAFEGLLDHAARTRPEGFCMANVVVRGRPDFAPDVRARLTKAPNRYPDQSIAVAHAVLLEGLFGTAVRTFFSTLSLVASSDTPSKIFKDLTATSAWLSQRLKDRGLPTDAGELRAALRQAVGR